MAGRFTNGETKVRPGVYFRTTSDGGINLAGTSNGVVAVAFKCNWGPLGQVVTLESPADVSDVFGDDSAADSNVSIINDVFLGGASVVKAVRVGKGGTNASVTLKDTTEETANDVVDLTAKFAGTRPLSVTIKDSLSNTAQRECVIYSGTRELEKILFEKGSGEVDALVAAINANSSVLSASKKAEGNGILADAMQTEFTTPGVSPSVSNSDYSEALNLLEAEEWNTVCVDSDETAVHTIVKTFITRANDAGQLGMAVTGEPTTVEYETRRTRAASYNSPSIVYALNGFTIGDVKYQGWKAAAYLAGVIAYLPANDSPTHTVMAGATEIVGPLTNTQIIECLQSGAIVFTKSQTGSVWIEQGINTLVNLSADQDAGWKKIRRTKTRYELIRRILANTEGVIGRIANDSNGRATLIAIGNGVIGQMIAENKLLSGDIAIDPSNPPSGDSAWFILSVVDLDSIEKVYLTFRFSFSED